MDLIDPTLILKGPLDAIKQARALLEDTGIPTGLVRPGDCLPNS